MQLSLFKEFRISSQQVLVQGKQATIVVAQYRAEVLNFQQEPIEGQHATVVCRLVRIKRFRIFILHFIYKNSTQASMKGFSSSLSLEINPPNQLKSSFSLRKDYSTDRGERGDVGNSAFHRSRFGSSSPSPSFFSSTLR